MFVPLGTHNGPCTSVLAVTRVTLVDYQGSFGHSEVIQDVWVGPQSRRPLEPRWTGSTVFQIRTGLPSCLEMFPADFEPIVTRAKATSKNKAKSSAKSKARSKKISAPPGLETTSYSAPPLSSTLETSEEVSRAELGQEAIIQMRLQIALDPSKIESLSDPFSHLSKLSLIHI